MITIIHINFPNDSITINHFLYYFKTKHFKFLSNFLKQLIKKKSKINVVYSSSIINHRRKKGKNPFPGVISIILSHLYMILSTTHTINPKTTNPKYHSTSRKR